MCRHREDAGHIFMECEETQESRDTLWERIDNWLSQAWSKIESKYPLEVSCWIPGCTASNFPFTKSTVGVYAGKIPESIQQIFLAAKLVKPVQKTKNIKQFAHFLLKEIATDIVVTAHEMWKERTQRMMTLN